MGKGGKKTGGFFLKVKDPSLSKNQEERKGVSPCFFLAPPRRLKKRGPSYEGGGGKEPPPVLDDPLLYKTGLGGGVPSPVKKEWEERKG